MIAFAARDDHPRIGRREPIEAQAGCMVEDLQATDIALGPHVKSALGKRIYPFVDLFPDRLPRRALAFHVHLVLAGFLDNLVIL